MGGLPEDEQKSVWAETERNWWHTFEEDNHHLYAKSEQKYQRQASILKSELEQLTAQRSYLTDRKERLAKELTQVEEELARTVDACENKVTILNSLERDYRKGEQKRLEKRSQVATAMEEFFGMKQGREDSAVPSQRVRDHLREVIDDAARSHFINSDRDAAQAEALAQANRVAWATQSLPLLESSRHSPSDHHLVNVVDADGHVIGPVKRIEPWNHWVQAIQNRDIQREVKIRRGRRFTQDHLDGIYDRTEAKGVKWLACMIQATGEVQSRRCQSCDKNQGAFDDCVVLGGHMFQKCGNCEWNRQGCHMASDQEDSKESTHVDKSGSETEALALREAPARRPYQPTRTYKSESSLGACQEPFQLPTPKENRFGQPQPTSTGFTAANARSRRPSLDLPTPFFVSAENSPPPGTDNTEITRKNLSLRHNGTVYVFPECVEGVPLAKIDERHPYWDPRWPSVQSIIQPQLDSWRIKFDEASKKKARGEGGSAKFQTGRQVNRGVKILEFLEEGDISPYQLLSKKYTHTGKGTITAYDTLFRMCETLGELAKFRLDISPVEWLRHRLHELIHELGADFNYSKIMHDFYHDPKLAALRDKNGFKSIGRPSGFRAGQNNGKNANPLSAKSSPEGAKKRKSKHSQPDTSRATSSAGHSPLSFFDDYNPPLLLSNSTPHATEPALVKAYTPKRLKPLSPASTAPDDEFGTGAVSETDSYSGAPLHNLDWRIYQVKSRICASNVAVTQYWHWKEDKRVFEHQVLRDVGKSTTWGVLRPPIDFHVPLDDIIQVDWNLDSLRVHFIMRPFGSVMSIQDDRPRGDVMASFKRSTTMRRFLSYCRQRRLKLVKVTSNDMEQRWRAMEAEELPLTDDEATSRSWG
ncbi:hypothetical protein AAL_02185 [Moelleriella libera RCEF 2490]|uniref:Uncharacterized protein n=1 Tax=Moelleriella libera RCEF 2490 TaxID=1081109 RepID=A0A168F946_9HYPO|nr:hypothetical protein AAL_02185 [Moelleriella libera RCEF 2490]